jgi:putative nucleotidyltransferase with HDIG domain
MDAAPHPRPSPGDRLKAAWHAARLWLIFGGTLVGIVVVLALPLAGDASTVGLELNQVAPQDLLAPYALSYTSELLTQSTRQAAADAVPDVYDPPSSRIARQQVERLQITLDYIDSVRADQFATREQGVADLQSIPDLDLDEAAASALLDLPGARWEAIRLEALSALEQVMRTEIREDRIEEARRAAPALVSISLTDDQAQLVLRLVIPFIAPNALLNAEATADARQAASEATPEVVRTFAVGETIVGRGELVTPIVREALQTYGLLRPENPWPGIAAQALLVGLLGCTFGLYAYVAHPDTVRSMRMVSVLGSVFLLTSLGMRLMIPERAVLPYLFPAATLPILTAVLIGPGMGLVTALVSGVLAGFLAPRGLEVGCYVMLSGAIGALLIGRAERLSTFFWTGVGASLAAVAVVAAFRFPDPATDILGKATLVGAALLSGGLSASLGFGLLLAASSLLGITTSLQLVELSRPDHPLLQLLLREAPGTYQHSLQVANLAEQAARAIGANALLTRVGALYHDVGKAVRPQFFIENQVAGQNVHEQLDPTTSASVILSHVRDGLDLARKHRLPPRIRAFIPEHHGTLGASYQLQAAVDAAGGDAASIDQHDFTYPGPRPRSKETALLMLADGVEAKARADAPTDELAIESLVQWVVEDRLTRGQLDRTDLTLKDIDTVRHSFTSTLKGIYHPRLRYPSGEEVEGTPPDSPAASPDTASSA